MRRRRLDGNLVRGRSARRLRPTLFGLVGGLLLFCGCGGGASYIRMRMERPANVPQPVWVGVYFLSQDTALDLIEADKLISKPEDYGPNNGVIDKEVFPLHPGEIHPIAREKYDSHIGWILLVTPASDPCARQKITVKPKSKISLDVSVEEKCLTVKQK